jgi:cell division protein FtsB
VKADRIIATYRRMREQPLWRLLASVNGPIVIGLLQTHLYESERRLPSSILHERITRDLEEIRAQGIDFPQTAQAYIAGWLAEGFLERRFPAEATEEEYELSTATVEAIRFLSSMEQPHSAATESRLALVIQALVKLAEDTDTDQSRRIDRLKAEQARIEKEIEAIQNGRMRVLPHQSALEQAREIISLTDELTGDFRRVRDQFDQLNRELRERLMDNEGSRGVVLRSVFTDIDQITESEAGKTFSAFWRLLTDPEQSATLEEALDNVMSREFVNELELKDRRFLRRMTSNLLEQGGIVHKVLQDFARSLKRFVQSREYLEQRRLNQILKDAQRAAIAIKDEVKTTNIIKDLLLTSSRIRSLSQWALYDPSIQALPDGMYDGDVSSIDLDLVAELVVQSEIDFRSLKANVRGALEKFSQASIHDILEQYPADQGLGSVVGLIALGSQYGIKSEDRETVSWVGNDEQQRSARIPKIFFLRERMDELV